MQLAALSKKSLFKSSFQKFAYPPLQSNLAIKMAYIRSILLTDRANVDLLSLCMHQILPTALLPFSTSAQYRTKGE